MNASNLSLGRRIRLGLIGGGGNALIGPVHRIAARLDDRFEICAGVLSSDPTRSVADAAKLVSGELLKAATKIDIKHVPYRGSAPMMSDLLGGHIKVAFDNLPTSLEHIRSGAVRALAVTSTSRFSGAPDIPAMAETIPGYEVIAWYGFLCPANTPRPIIDLLYRNVAEILKEDPIRKRLEEMSALPGGNSPAEFAMQIDLEIKKWKDVVAATGLQPE